MTAGERAQAAPRGGDPSAWSRRLPAAALAGCGLAIATYLMLFQLGAIAAVWEPLTGDGSRRVLTSALADALPVPDAALGAAAYAVEAALLLAGGGALRWSRHPRLVLALGIVATGVASGGVALLAVQAFIVEAFCTLCLVSAAISCALFVLAVPEVRSALRHRHRGAPANSHVPTAHAGAADLLTSRARPGAPSDHH